MVVLPYIRVFVAPLYSFQTGEEIGVQKIRLHARFVGGQWLVSETRFCAMLPKGEKPDFVEKAGWGYWYYTSRSCFTEKRIYEMGAFFHFLPQVCPVCNAGVMLEQRPGKYGCNNCEN
jgi:hypothetical protein